MIDFRYHIVSLIAVFLALAVGIALGAGPLRGSLGDQLTEQIEVLREEKEQQRVEISELNSQVEDLEAFIGAASDRLVPGSLTDVDIAVVEMPGADGGVVQAVEDRIAQAGGAIVGQVTLSQSWVDAADAQVRADTATTIGAQMLVPPSDDADPDQVLGTGLAQALTQRDPLTSEGFTSAAQNIYATLLDGELIGEVTEPARPADVVLVLSPAPDDEPDADVLATETDTLRGLGVTQVVVAGTDDDAGDLVRAVRGDGDLAELMSTVDNLDDDAGQVLVPLALATVAVDQTIGHYGMSDGTTSVLPPLPTPPATEDESTSTDDTTDTPTDEATGEEESP